MTIKKGDKVWWRIKAGMFFRTLSGTVEEINDNIASVKVSTQNVHGAIYKKHVNHLNLKQ